MLGMGTLGRPVPSLRGSSGRLRVPVLGLQSSIHWYRCYRFRWASSWVSRWLAWVHAVAVVGQVDEQVLEPLGSSHGMGNGSSSDKTTLCLPATRVLAVAATGWVGQSPDPQGDPPAPCRVLG